jgi:hypothetical protein
LFEKEGKLYVSLIFEMGAHRKPEKFLRTNGIQEQGTL